ncbi:MAG: molybdopterin-dependent oxidoreductase, partial [Pseudomonadota bacterium]
VPRVKWGGIMFSDLLKLVEPLPSATHVLFHSLGETTSAPSGQRHYIECFKLADLLDPEQRMLLALDIDGRPLPAERGAPLRVTAPFKLAYKSIKFVHRMEFVDEMKEGWWTIANPIYDVEAEVPTWMLEDARRSKRE